MIVEPLPQTSKAGSPPKHFTSALPKHDSINIVISAQAVTMLPPVDPSILSANPKFEALYRDLCTNKLNPDGSSAFDQKAQKERDVFATDLRTARLEAAKRDVMRSELRSIAYRGDALPSELQEMVAITAATLDGEVPDEDHDVVQDYVDGLIENPSRVAAAIEQNLNRNATLLAQTISPDSKPDHSQILLTLTELNKSVTLYRSNIAATHLNITDESNQVHELYRQILASSIRLLEQTIHGSVSRASKAKAEYLAIVAEGMAKKLGMQYQQLMSQMYSGDIQEELRERSAEMSRDERNIRRKLENADDKLGQYRSGRGMEGIANEYAEILGETARVRGDIAKLEMQQRS
ncbi:hypothetical protein Q7P37_003818 [Cladosporium fusiforme]